MAVFVSASDETAGKNQQGRYTYAGLIAKERYWERVFAKEWDRRVLAGPPRIPYLHMTEIRSRKWREEHGIDRDEADRRVFQATEVLAKARHIYPIAVNMSGADFQSQVARVAKNYRTNHKAALSAITQPDCACFIYYALHVLLYVHDVHSDAEHVDFVVERNDRITTHMEHYYALLPSLMKDPECSGGDEPSPLLALMGDFLPGDKKRVPLQATDMFCWHKQRVESGLANDEEIRRYDKLTNRKGYDYDIPSEYLQGFGERLMREHEPRQAKT